MLLGVCTITVLIASLIGLGYLSLPSEKLVDTLSEKLLVENEDNKEVSYVSEMAGPLELYFCPQDDCDIKLLEFLGSAEESVHCALYEVDNILIGELLLDLESNPEIDFKLVVDDTYQEDFDHDFVIYDSYGFMHNKFCVVDETKVFTGSMNPTDNGFYHNNNNIFFIESPLLAANYEAEFQELWAEDFKDGEPVLNEKLKLQTEEFGEVDIRNYFCPEDDCAEEVKTTLETAEQSIHFMTFSFTHDSIENVLLIKHDEGKDVKGVLEARSATQYSPYEVFQFQGIEIYKDANSKTMHHKVFIIDGETVITGSMNPTASGDERNDENVLIIKNKAIAELFEEEFEKVFGEAQEKASEEE